MGTAHSQFRAKFYGYFSMIKLYTGFQERLINVAMDFVDFCQEHLFM